MLASRQIGRPKRAAKRAYTAIEVMMSIIVLGIGAAGVMSMQKAAIQGNNDARQMDMANSIAREWIERLRRDAATWTQPDTTNLTNNWSTNTWLITQFAGTAAVGSFQYLALPSSGSALPSGYSIAFDALGRDYALPTTSTTAPPIYCTQVRGDWLVQDQLLRVTVRVYWLRQMLAAPTGGLTCTASDAPDTNPGTTYHSVFATTALRRTPAQ
jgi:prepilin-type N-terminal cleavage/methylation domain-containing protein